MRFLVDANLPRSALPLLHNFGHTAEHAHGCGASLEAPAPAKLACKILLLQEASTSAA